MVRKSPNFSKKLTQVVTTTLGELVSHCSAHRGETPSCRSFGAQNREGWMPAAAAGMWGWQALAPGRPHSPQQQRLWKAAFYPGTQLKLCKKHGGPSLPGFWQEPVGGQLGSGEDIVKLILGFKRMFCRCSEYPLTVPGTGEAEVRGDCP